MLGKIIATAVAVIVVAVVVIVLAHRPAQPSGCVLQLANGDPHSSISQHLQINLGKRINTSRFLSLTDTVGRYDLEFYLVRAPANDIARYPQDSSYRAFYVITDSHRRLISADVTACTGNGEACAVSLAMNIEDTCKRMASNSFKPNPLRGPA